MLLAGTHSIELAVSLGDCWLFLLGDGVSSHALVLNVLVAA